MAEILIKGLEMPKDDILRIEICPNGQVNRIIGWALSEMKRGEAIEVPPHGDLIDRNELPIIGITDYMNEGHTVVELEDVQNAPTVIPASEGE